MAFISKRRSFLVGAVTVVAAALAMPAPVSAAASGWFADYDDSWSEWRLSKGAVAGSALLTFNSVCSSGPAGPTIEGQNEFRFSFTVGSNCFSTGDIGDGPPIALFTWEYLNEAGLPIDFECLDVRGASTGDIESVIVFQPALIASASSTNRTSVQLSDINSVEFALIVPYLNLEDVGELQSERLGVQNGYSTYFDIEISISECGGWDGPDIDIEHYRRMAEQATALPDTL